MARSAEDETPESYVQRKLASQDKRFQAALAEANAAGLVHQGERGAEFEEDVRKVLRRFLPGTYHVRGGFMPPLIGQEDPKKQLDVVIRPISLPKLIRAVPVELITIAGEIKTTLSDEGWKDYVATAEILGNGAVLAGRRQPMPFFVLAGQLKRKTGHAAWLASVVSDALAAAPDEAEVWPAAFSFDERSPMSVIPVGPSAPMSAVTADSEELSGVISIAGEALSVSAVCYLWLWACLYSFEAVPDMEMRYMRDALYRELTGGRGLPVSYWPLGEDGTPQPVMASLLFTGGAGARAERSDLGPRSLPVRDEADREPVTGPRTESAPEPEDESATGEPGSRRFIMITLGSWVEEHDSWDESLWGGSATASRRGYGYYEGMTDQELLDASRLFWRFNRDSGNWDGIDYAVVAHAGKVRAVIRITSIIGPLWGRYGFQGHIVKDSELARELIGQAVPVRQNPITTVKL